MIQHFFQISCQKNRRESLRDGSFSIPVQFKILTEANYLNVMSGSRDTGSDPVSLVITYYPVLFVTIRVSETL